MVPQKMLESSIKKKKMKTMRIPIRTNISLKMIMLAHKVIDRLRIKMTVFKKVLREVLSVKVINKMIVKKVWEWAWVTDKEVVMMLKMKVAVSTSSPKVVVQLIHFRRRHTLPINKDNTRRS
jgi:hypothetical protein